MTVGKFEVESPKSDRKSFTSSLMHMDRKSMELAVQICESPTIAIVCPDPSMTWPPIPVLYNGLTL